MTLIDTGELALDIITLVTLWPREGAGGSPITAARRLKIEPPDGGSPANSDQAQINSIERKDPTDG